MAMDKLIELAARFEAASEGYAALHQIERDRDWFVLKLQEEVGEQARAWVRLTGRGRGHSSPAELQQQLADEVADVLGHVLLIAHRNEVDLAAAIRRKWKFEP